MTEVIGLVSGGAGLASLALQLMETAVKLKGLAKAYKQAPDSLERLTFEIETFGLVLEELERDRQAHDSPIDNLLTRCILSCQQSVHRIRGATDRLEKMIGRMKPFGKLMTALEEKETLQIFHELERAKSTLLQAHDLYLASRRERGLQRSLVLSEDIRRILVQQNRDIQQLRNDLVILPVTGSAKPPDHVTDHPVAAVNREQAIVSPRSVTSTRNKGIRTNQQKLRILEVKAWFLSRIWQISLDRTPAGWDVKLCTWNVRPMNEAVFILCFKGDLLGVQKLIEDGKASYYDVDEGGETLLSFAIAGKHVALVRHLLEFTESWAVLSGLEHSLAYEVDSSDGVKLYSLLFSDPRLDLSDLLMDRFGPLDDGWLRSSTSEHLNIILSNLSEPWESRTLAQRFEFAMGLAEDCACSTFRLALGPCSMEELVDLRDKCDSSALHFAAAAYLYHIDDDWGDMIVKLIKLGCAVCGKNRLGETAFTFALDAVTTPQGLLKFLEEWLKLVWKAGVDTEAYGWEVEQDFSTSKEPMAVFRREQIFVIEQVVTGPKYSDWDLIGCVYRHVPVWYTLEMPGQFERYPGKCCAFPWEPTQNDECVLSKNMLSLSIWQRGSMTIFSAPVSLRALAQRGKHLDYEVQFEMYDRCKDELDLNYVFRDRWKRKPPQRSRSQPPDLRSSGELDARDECFRKREEHWSGLHWHRCRLDSRWRLQKRSFLDKWDDRKCMAGCPLDFSHLESKIFQGLQWAARRYEEGVKDSWNMLY